MPRDRHTPDGLTERQRAFVQAFATNGGNATEAARAAGYSGGDRNLQVLGSRTLKHPRVREALAAKGVTVGDGNRSGRRGAAATRSSSRGSSSSSSTQPRARRSLTPQQTRALEQLLAGATHAEAAKAAGVARETVTRWLDDSAFRAELDAHRLAALERGRLRVEGLIDDALAVTAAVLGRTLLCTECSAKVPAPSRDALTTALALLDRAGVGSRALDVPALRERLRGEAAAALAELLRERLPADVYRQVTDALRGLRSGAAA